MANEIRGSRATSASVAPDRTLEQSTHNAQTRKIRKQKIRESMELEHNLEEVSQEAKEQFESIVEIAAEQFFSKTPEGGSFHRTAEAVPHSLQELYDSAGVTDASIAEGFIDISYLAGEEVEALLSFLDVDGKKKEEFDELSRKLEHCEEGEEEGLIDSGAKGACGGKTAEIYLMLCYLYEDLVRKKSKERLQERLKKILKAFERQESSYLFNFFSSQEILKNLPANSVNFGAMDKMANISSGREKLESLRQTLQFVTGLLTDKDMHRMVSLFMKFQAKNLKRISTLNEGRESKEEIANILQQERNLIIINSLYNQCRRVIVKMRKITSIEEKYSEFLNTIVTVLETSMINVEGMIRLEKNLGMPMPSLEINRAFIKQFHMLLSKVPKQVFVSETLRDKLLSTIQNMVTQIESLLEPKSSGLSFLRRKLPTRTNKI